MRLERHQNFLSQEDCNILNDWVDEGVKNKWLDFGISRKQSNYTKRVTSRLYGNRFEYPQIVLDISNRIRKFCGVDSYGLIEGHGRDGVVVSCTFPGGDVYKHQDPKNQNELSALRCNVMTRGSDAGGKLYVNGEHIDVTEVEGDTSRVLWMFGAYVPKEDWESGRIKINNLGNK